MHSNNVIFASDQFYLDYDKINKEKYFSGVGANHQNERDEREIQTIMYTARNFMVHYSLHWSDHGADYISLLSFAIKHAVWLHNIFNTLPLWYHTTRVSHQK